MALISATFRIAAPQRLQTVWTSALNILVPREKPDPYPGKAHQTYAGSVNNFWRCALPVRDGQSVAAMAIV
jgi:hypothetical protein